MLARHYDSMGRTTSMYTDSVGPTRRPRVHRQPNQPTPVNHQDPCTTRPPTQRHPGVHHFGSALPTQRAENGASAGARSAVAGSGDLVDAVGELAQVGDLEDAVAVPRVLAHHRVGGVPLAARLRVEPVEAARAGAELAQRLHAGVAVVAAGVAHHDQGAAAVEVAAPAFGEALQHLAVVAVPVVGD